MQRTTQVRVEPERFDKVRKLMEMAERELEEDPDAETAIVVEGEQIPKEGS